MGLTNPIQPILCIAGPTASGKSALALAYAEHQRKRGIACEIICVDSATIYRGMDIGTAKPSPSELEVCPHHLVDIRDPSERYSTGEFARDGLKLIDEIRNRGAEPLLVGGTMLYFKALLEGIDDLPAADPVIRAEIDQEALRMGWPALHQSLMAIDPITATRLNPNDSQRIQRAIEVYRSTGKPLSAYFGQSKDDTTHHAIQSTFQLVALEPDNRSWLHDRIAIRFDTMLHDGLIEEVRTLHSRGDLNADLPSMRCVGYRQIWDLLKGQYNETEMRERGIAATRQLAKRQLTWLRGWNGKKSLIAETAGLEDLIRAISNSFA